MSSTVKNQFPSKGLWPPLLALFFSGSGFCGLLYQLVWVRLAYASFGINAPVLSVVLSVFMAGLGLGSWAGGALSERWRNASTGLVFYALAEGLIGLGAFAVPYSFNWGEGLLLSAGDTDSARYLYLSAVVILFSLLPWCFLMGTTIPFMMAFIRRDSRDPESFSFLYLSNVMGAMAGVAATAFVLIEWLGFHRTLAVGAATNAAICLGSLLAALGVKAARRPRHPVGPSPRSSSQAEGTGLPILFTTGWVCMAMEVVWTRDFTIVLNTQVYSFAALLFTYLLSTSLGSWCYRRFHGRARLTKSFLLACTLGCSLFPLLLDDPRVQFTAVGTLLSIAPFCLCLGYLTPLLVDGYSQGDPGRASRAYALNVFGCILGPLTASYLLLPHLGVKYSILLLSLFFAPFLAKEALRRGRWPAPERVAVAVGGVLVAFCSMTAGDFEMLPAFWYKRPLIQRDYMATVICGGDDLNKGLYVNGISMTGLGVNTKMMAHLPLALLGHKPGSALDICFGMGATFRSLLSWNIRATAVELDPSVLNSFGYFFPDAELLTGLPWARLVVDDGRRYLKRHSETFDVITVDPPPPIEAAGSSMLYCSQFYELVKRRLKPGGILQQWMPPTGDWVTAQAIVRTLSRSFPYVRVFPSVEYFPQSGTYQRLGYFFICSITPTLALTGPQMAERLPPSAQKDLMEWSKSKDCRRYLEGFLSQELPLGLVLDPKLDHVITYDRPYNEYFLLRRSPAGRKLLALF